MKQSPFTAKRWRRVEYERLVDVGAFEGEPVELIGGQLIVAKRNLSTAPVNADHDCSLAARQRVTPAGGEPRAPNG